MKGDKERLALAIGIGASMCVAQVATGILAGSLALIADSAHLFLDVVALGLAYLGLRIGDRPPDERYSYGYHRVQVLTALVNGLSLVVVAGFVLKEAVARFLAPTPVLAGPVLGVALAGLVANLAMALILGHHEEEDLNMRAAFLHVLGDLLGSLAVIVSAAVVLTTRITWVDPAASVLIVLILAVGAIRVLRQTLPILGEGVPEGISLGNVGDALRTIPGVQAVHDLHVWSLGPGFPALSAHLVVGECSGDERERILAAARQTLDQRFAIRHVTLQLECTACAGPVCSGPECP